MYSLTASGTRKRIDSPLRTFSLILLAEISITVIDLLNNTVPEGWRKHSPLELHLKPALRDLRKAMSLSVLNPGLLITTNDA